MRFPCWSLWLLLNETLFQFQFVYSQPIRIEAVRGQDPNLAFAERNPESKTLLRFPCWSVWLLMTWSLIKKRDNIGFLDSSQG